MISEVRVELVTIWPKYQIVIPKRVREQLSLKAGQKLQVLDYQGQLVLIPVKPVKSLRGIARGIDTTVKREGDRM